MLGAKHAGSQVAARALVGARCHLLFDLCACVRVCLSATVYAFVYCVLMCTLVFLGLQTHTLPVLADGIYGKALK